MCVMGWAERRRSWGGGELWWLCVAAAAAHVVEDAVDLALVTGEAHGHALAGSLGAHYLALLAVLDLVAILEGLTCPREVDVLSDRVAARQGRWRLAAYLYATRPS